MEVAEVQASSPLSDALADRSWEFADSRSRDQRFTHTFHPYPAKFIPEIPAAVLDQVGGDAHVILDPFCGSGTVLVEAVARGLHAIGVDVHPLAGLVARVKSTPLPPAQADIDRVTQRAAQLAAAFHRTGRFERQFLEAANHLAGPRFSGIEFWFTTDAIGELSSIRAAIEEEEGLFRDQALAAMSAMVVRASLQDSDTRYVRRQKRLRPLDSVEWFRNRLTALRRGLDELASVCGAGSSRVMIGDARALADMALAQVDVVITSSPYPNAFSYHLYHQLRCLWLGLPVEGLRSSEIGNHRDYSRRQGHDAETFVKDMQQVLSGIRQHCSRGCLLVFVIGNSIVRGEAIDNVVLLRRAASAAGLRWQGSTARTIKAHSKSFNPAIGKIRSESVCFMEAS